MPSLPYPAPKSFASILLHFIYIQLPLYSNAFSFKERPLHIFRTFFAGRLAYLFYTAIEGTALSAAVYKAAEAFTDYTVKS